MDFPTPSFVDINSIKDSESLLLSILEKNSKNIINIPPVGQLNISVKTACCFIDKKYDIKKMAQKVDELLKDYNTFTPDGKRKVSDSPIIAINYTKDSDNDIVVKNSKTNNNFYNSICVTVKIRDDKNINLMIFTNGRITCTGSKNDDDGLIAANHLLMAMKKFPEIFDSYEDCKNAQVVNYDIVMINSNFFVGFYIDNSKLYEILINNRSKYNLFCSYDPRTYQGVKIYYMWNNNQTQKNGICVCSTKKCKFSAKKKNGNGNGDCRRISVAVFGTGKVLIAGAKNNSQLYDTYNFIVSILQENYREIVQFSVEDKKKIVKNSSSVVKKIKPII